jgi:ubiquinone/menaquinone biosynthesis C-methylase UbiE
MSETSKAFKRRNREGFFRYYCQGAGIDLGCGSDPVLPTVRQWDWQDGDATYLKEIADSTYNFVYSSHLLQILCEPHIGLRNWWRILKPGGFLLLLIPHRDLAKPTPDDKTGWLIDRNEPPNTWGIIPMISENLKGYVYLYVVECSENKECSIEVVLRKRP